MNNAVKNSSLLKGGGQLERGNKPVALAAFLKREGGGAKRRVQLRTNCPTER